MKEIEVVEMNKLRFYFSKEPSVKYVGHLDLIEVFDRAFRRAKMPLSFSEGFNPRPKLSFAHPLAVGISSVGEIGEIELDEKIQIIEFINKMNESLPSGIRILNADYVIDAIIPFVDRLITDEDIAKTEPIFSDESVMKTLEKSPATTSNVNERLRRVKALLMGQ